MLRIHDLAGDDEEHEIQSEYQLDWCDLSIESAPDESDSGSDIDSLGIWKYARWCDAKQVLQSRCFRAWKRGMIRHKTGT